MKLHAQGTQAPHSSHSECCAPGVQAYVFKRQKVQDVIGQALQERMEGGRYDPAKGAQVC